MINNTQDREVIEQENSIVKRYDLTNYLIEQYNFVDYLEIGVAFGNCVRNVKVKNKDAVDPVVEANVRCPEINYEMTSNEFFALEKIQNKKYDVIFIDGLHETTQVDIDIQNSLKHLNEGGFILLHDCNPVSYESQLVPRQATAWNGNVWKSIVKLRCSDVDLDINVVDTDYGVGVIAKGKNKKIDKFTLDECLDWNTFSDNKKYILNLIGPGKFFEKYGK